MHIEYGIIVALIALVILGSVKDTGCEIKHTFSTIAHTLNPHAPTADHNECGK